MAVRAGCLAVGLSALLSGRGAFLLAHCAGPLAAAFAIWHIAIYTASAIAPLGAASALAAAIGVPVFLPPPPAALPLTAHLLVVIVLAGLRRRR